MLDKAEVVTACGERHRQLQARIEPHIPSIADCGATGASHGPVRELFGEEGVVAGEGHHVGLTTVELHVKLRIIRWGLAVDNDDDVWGGQRWRLCGRQG